MIFIAAVLGSSYFGVLVFARSLCRFRKAQSDLSAVRTWAQMRFVEARRQLGARLERRIEHEAAVVSSHLPFRLEPIQDTAYLPHRAKLNRFNRLVFGSAWAVGMGVLPRKPVKLRDVAEAAGVSQGTASNVWNRPELVRDEVRERVLEAARSLGYGGPSPKGRLLRAGRANAIGVAAAEPLDYFFSDPWARRLMSEVARACDARGAGLALVSVGQGQTLGWSIESALVDGFLLRCGGRELLVEITQKRGLPFVALSLDTEEPNVPAIDIDDFGGARAAARHLAGLGHRRVAVLGIGLGEAPSLVSAEVVRGTRFVNVRERALGYWAGLAESGIAESAVPVLAIRDDASNVTEALDLIFRATSPPTAILAMSDKVAMATLKALQKRGLDVPRDVSVVGFDDVPEAELTRPALTTVAQPYRLIAERSVAAILDDAIPKGREVLPLELIVRDSTARAAT